MAKTPQVPETNTPKKFDVRRLLTYLAFIALGYGLMVAYFQPAFVKKNVLYQSDILQVKGMSKEIHDFRKKNQGEETLWTSRMFGGMPTYQIDARYPSNFLSYLDKALKLGLPHPAGNFFLCFLGMFVLLWAFRLDPWVAAVGAAAYAFSSYFFVAMEAGHNAKINALGYAPAVIAGLVLAYRGRILLGGALFALAMGMELYANHFQITYYLIFVVLAIVISELAMSVKPFNRLALLGLLIIPVIWAVDPCNDYNSVWIIIGLLTLVAPLALELVQNLGGGGWKAPGFVRTKRFITASLVLLVAGLLAAAPNLGRLYTTQEYKADTMRGGVVLESTSHCTGGQAALTASDSTNAGDCERTGGLKKPYAYNWSYGISETWTLVNPYYMGDASGAKLSDDSETYSIFESRFGAKAAEQISASWPLYYGPQPLTSGPVYVGATVFFLFLLGLLLVNDRYRWWLLAATLLSIFLSWGKNWQWFSDLFFDHFPLYNNFRAVSMTLVIAELTMPVLAALAVHKVLKNQAFEPKKLERFILIAGGTAVGILLILLALKPGTNDFFIPGKDSGTLARYLSRLGVPGDQGLQMDLEAALIADRSSMFTNGMLRSIGLIIATAGTLFAYVRFIRPRFQGSRAWTGHLIASGVLFAIVVLDLQPIAKRYINDDSFVPRTEFMKPYNPTSVDNELLADRDPNFRVLNLTRDPWNDAFTAYYHKSIGGYHAAKFRRYQDMIDCHLDAEKNAIIAGLQSGQLNPALQSAKAMNMLNMKYLVLPTNQGTQKVENPYRYGNAWMVGKLEMVKTNVEEIDGIQKYDPRETAIVNDEWANQLQGFSPALDTNARISIASYKPNEIVYNYDAPGGKEQLVVFSEIFYNKGWNASIDGQPADHFRANYILRAMRVPGGQHTVTFVFEPDSYKTGETIGLIGSILLLLAVLGVGFLAYRGKLYEPVDPNI